jgi:lincosamide nucleotidyltransferase A/C/D/E
MQASDVREFLSDLAKQGFIFWVTGGWGVDALVGHQTRPHQDLDVEVPLTQLKAIMAHLDERGYRVTVDWLPVRVEMTSLEGLKVDLHPLTFDAQGNGRQEGLHGNYYLYPADQFTTGTIEGMSVPCIGKELQMTFHQGYSAREIDLLDLDELARL